MNAIMNIDMVMNETRARKIVFLINDKMREIGELLTELRDLEGWRALGYQSWTQFLESDELIYSRKRCLEFVRAFPVTVRLREELNITITTEVALTLAPFPEDIQVLAVQTAINHKKPITAARTKDYALVYQEAAATGGYVTNSDGEQRAITDAFKAQRTETELTRIQAERVEGEISRKYQQEDGYYIVVRMDSDHDLQTGQTVILKAKE